MAVGNVILFGKNKDDIRLNDIVGASVKLALVKNTYTPDVTVTGHSLWSEVSAEEIAAGNGYSAGGVALTSLAAVALSGGFKFDSDDAVWNASGGNIPVWRYGVLRIDGSLWGMTNPLIGYFVADDTPADYPITVDGNPLTVNVPANGWFNIP